MKTSKGGDTKYFVFSYHMPYGVHHAQGLKKQLKDDPTTQKFMAQGYSQPEMISGIPDDIDSAIEHNQKIASHYADKKNEFPVQYYDAVEAIKRYTKLKDIMSTVKIEK